MVDFENWKIQQELVIGIADKNPETYIQAIAYFNPFDDIGELGTQIELSISDSLVDVDVHISKEEVIPDFELRQTSTGKLSKKKMSKSRFNELYQDHICSSIIRVSRELFAYLPLEKARVNAIGKVINSSTGHLEEQPLLSVIMIPGTINSLNLDTIDPSDSMQNFVHNMKFSKVNGFSPVDKVELK